MIWSIYGQCETFLTNSYFITPQ